MKSGFHTKIVWTYETKFVMNSREFPKKNYVMFKI